MNERAPQSAGEAKVSEYVARIKSGEDAGKLLEGIGPAMRQAVEAGLAVPEQKEEVILPEEEPSPEEIAVKEQKQEQEKAKLADIRESLGIAVAENNPESNGSGLKARLDTFSEKARNMSSMLRERNMSDPLVADATEAMRGSLVDLKEGISKMLPSLNARYPRDMVIGNQLGLIKGALDAMESGDRFSMYGQPNADYSSRVKVMSESVRLAAETLIKKYEAA